MNVHEKNRQVLLHLLLSLDVGPSTIFKLIIYCVRDELTDLELNNVIACLPKLNDGLLDVLYELSVSDLMQRVRLPEKVAQAVVKGLKETKYLEQELKLIEQHGARLVTVFDDEYPKLLAAIHVPPPALYVKGDSLTQFDKTIAFVGARLADDYGRKFIRETVPELVEQGWCIVSGGARGADTMAHQYALQAGGKTLGVIGSGLLTTYPPENKKLFEQIAQQGAMVSSFPMRAAPDKTHFPMRNRIISGLSQGSVVVQAAQKSGALITSTFALEQGRHVFAVPGDVYNPLSAGCHNLISQGATLVTNAQDILTSFGETAVVRKPVERNIVMFDDPLVQALSQACSVDELSQKSKMPFDEVMNKLFELQLEGKVTQTFSGLWERV